MAKVLPRKSEPIAVGKSIVSNSVELRIGNLYGATEGAGSRSTTLDVHEARIVAYALLAEAEQCAVRAMQRKVRVNGARGQAGTAPKIVEPPK